MRLLSRGVARAAVCGRLLVGGGRLERQRRVEAGVRLNLWGGVVEWTTLIVYRVLYDQTVTRKRMDGPAQRRSSSPPPCDWLGSARLGLASIDGDVFFRLLYFYIVVISEIPEFS